MAYRVTITNIKTNPDSPIFSDWLASLEDSGILDACYPEYTGIPLSGIVSDTVAEKIENPAVGFISAENTETTYTTLWESKQAYDDAIASGQSSGHSHDTAPLAGTISTSTHSSTVVGVGTAFLTDVEVGEYIHHITSASDNYGEYSPAPGLDYTVGIVQSIESDTSLTLEDNPRYVIEGVTYHTQPKMSVLAFLQRQYNLLHPITTTIETEEI